MRGYFKVIHSICVSDQKTATQFKRPEDISCNKLQVVNYKEGFFAE